MEQSTCESNSRPAE